MQDKFTHYSYYPTPHSPLGKDSFYSPPLVFYREYVLLMYFLITRLFSSMAFFLEMHNKRDMIF